MAGTTSCAIVAELFGKLEWDPGYDVKAESERQR